MSAKESDKVTRHRRLFPVDPIRGYGTRNEERGTTSSPTQLRVAGCGVVGAVAPAVLVVGVEVNERG